MKANYFKQFKNVLVFYFNMEPRLKLNKNVLWVTYGDGLGMKLLWPPCV